MNAIRWRPDDLSYKNTSYIPALPESVGLIAVPAIATHR
jgi:hypothetical protein